MTPYRPIPACLSIAGSDSGGGAGIQADLKAFARCGVHGMTAITALTAQNTVGVEMITPVPPETIVAQVRAVADDIGVDGVKVGMLGDEPTIEAVVQALDLVREAPIVVDPVMVSQSGAVLLDPNAKAALIERVLPLATVVTPNLPEARELAGLGADARPEELAEAIAALGPEAVIVTGGPRGGRRRALRRVRNAAHRRPPVRRGGVARVGMHAFGRPCGLPRTRNRAGRRGPVGREIAAEAVGNGLRELGAGTGPVDVFALARGVPPRGRGPA